MKYWMLSARMAAGVWPRLHGHGSLPVSNLSPNSGCARIAPRSIREATGMLPASSYSRSSKPGCIITTPTCGAAWHGSNAIRIDKLAHGLVILSTNTPMQAAPQAFL